MTDIQMYLVGGAVRDGLIGKPTKDYDYSVVVDPSLGLTIEESFQFMSDHLGDLGFKIFLSTPEYQTIRARFPKGHEHEKVTADFVLARKDGPYTDGRRPDWVKPGTLEDDLRRRDFTVNAMAETEDGTIIDLFGGIRDLADKRLRTVGDPIDRLSEDPLRAYRAVRFAITKGFTIDKDLEFCMRVLRVQDGMRAVAAERIKDELHKCFAFDTVATLELMTSSFPFMLDIMQEKGIWLMPTMKEPK